MSRTSMDQPLLLVSMNTVRHENYKSRQSLFLNIAQIILGIICIICQIAGMVFLDTFAFYAGGIWGGILMVVAGGIGIGAARRKSACLITAAMVMSILASASVLYILTLSSMGITAKTDNYYGTCMADNCDSYPECPFTRDSSCVAALAMHSVLLICGVAELVVAIWVSALTCAITCYCDKQNTAQCIEIEGFGRDSSPAIQQSGQVLSVQNVGTPSFRPNNGNWTQQTNVTGHLSTTHQLAGQSVLTSNTQSPGQSFSGYNMPTNQPVTGPRQQQSDVINKNVM